LNIIESNKFKTQLRFITLYIKKDKPSSSIKFVKDLRIQIKDIVNMPKKYRKSIYFDNDNIRDMIYKGYTIVYELFDKYIEIQMIFNKNLPILENRQTPELMGKKDGKIR